MKNFFSYITIAFVVIYDKIKVFFEKAIPDSFLRNVVILLVIAGGLYVLNFESPFVIFLIKCGVSFFLIIWLANSGLWAYTRLKTSKILIQGRNAQTDTKNEYWTAQDLIKQMLWIATVVVLFYAYSVYYLESGKELSKLTGLPFLP